MISESLERDLSNGIIKVHTRQIKVFANLAVPLIVMAHGLRTNYGPDEILDLNPSSHEINIQARARG